MDIYLVSHPMERPEASVLVAALQTRVPGLQVYWEAQIARDVSWEEWDAEARRTSAVTVGLLTPDYADRSMFDYRIAQALHSADRGDAPFVAVLLGPWADAPPALASQPSIRWPRGGDADDVAAQILVSVGGVRGLTAPL